MGVAKHVRRFAPRLWFYFRCLRYKFYKGEPEIWLIAQLVPSGKLAVDVGSSIGIFSREMAKRANRVVAFEANPSVAAFARRVAPRRVETINLALSSTDGTATLRIPLSRRSDTMDDLATIEPKNPLSFDRVVEKVVRATQLDAFDFADCGFIKIDTEGHEEAVLAGAMNLITAQRPIMLIELDETFNPNIFARVTERLSQLAYSAYALSGTRLRPATAADAQGQAISFIFLPAETREKILKSFAAPNGLRLREAIYAARRARQRFRRRTAS